MSSLIESMDQCNAAIGRLLLATLKHEAAVAVRDREILAVQKQHAASITTAAGQIVTLEKQIVNYCLDHKAEIETAGKKSLQLSNGLIGFRLPTQPALVPLSEEWSWEKIADKVRELWAKKYFHKPKAPGLDKVKLKKDLTPEQLEECGLQLDTEEQFYLELNRLAMADPIAQVA